jgi:hypothetical protein
MTGCRVIAQCCERFHVPFKRGLERLRLLPFWMQWGHGVQAIERESQLGIDRMFHPQGPVIVERRDAFGGRHEIWPALQRNAGNEVSDRPLLGPSFHEGRRSACACACFKMGSAGPNKTESAPAVVSRKRRSMPRDAGVDFII